MISALLAGIFGLLVGSFANVVIDRVPAGRSIRGRSVCDRCRRQLRWWELVPVVSAFALRFRCPTCDGRIAVRMAAVEIGTAVLFFALVQHAGVTIQAAIGALGLTALGILAVIDLREQTVPDVVSVPAIVLLAAGQLLVTRSPIVLATVAIGAGFFGIQRLLSRGRWVGDGDTRVGALMGALLPSLHLAVALAASYIIGGLLAGVLLALRRVERGAHIPLVPFLFLGSIVAVFWGDAIIAWYGW